MRDTVPIRICSRPLNSEGRRFLSKPAAATATRLRAGPRRSLTDKSPGPPVVPIVFWGERFCQEQEMNTLMGVLPSLEHEEGSATMSKVKMRPHYDPITDPITRLAFTRSLKCLRRGASRDIPQGRLMSRSAGLRLSSGQPSDRWRHVHEWENRQIFPTLGTLAGRVQI